MDVGGSTHGLLYHQIVIKKSMVYCTRELDISYRLSQDFGNEFYDFLTKKKRKKKLHP